MYHPNKEAAGVRDEIVLTFQKIVQTLFNCGRETERGEWREGSENRAARQPNPPFLIFLLWYFFGTFRALLYFKDSLRFFLVRVNT